MKSAVKRKQKERKVGYFIEKSRALFLFVYLSVQLTFDCHCHWHWHWRCHWHWHWHSWIVVICLPMAYCILSNLLVSIPVVDSFSFFCSVKSLVGFLPFLHESLNWLVISLSQLNDGDDQSRWSLAALLAVTPLWSIMHWGLLFFFWFFFRLTVDYSLHRLLWIL